MSDEKNICEQCKKELPEDEYLEITSSQVIDKVPDTDTNFFCDSKCFEKWAGLIKRSRFKEIVENFRAEHIKYNCDCWEELLAEIGDDKK